MLFYILCFSISQILAIMRQWVPQTQLAIDTLIMQILKRGAHPDDRFANILKHIN
jgi:hypothetical protein